MNNDNGYYYRDEGEYVDDNDEDDDDLEIRAAKTALTIGSLASRYSSPPLCHTNILVIEYENQGFSWCFASFEGFIFAMIYFVILLTG